MTIILRYLRSISKLLIILFTTLLILNYLNRRTQIIDYQDWRKELENEDLRFILLWNNDTNLNILKTERKSFIDNKCQYTNCFVTRDKNFSRVVYTNFDAIVISSKYVFNDLPVKRYHDQLFIFASKEPADKNLVCDKQFDNYFNLTWTYKLNSDIVWPHFTVFDKHSNVIAPKVNINWINDMMKLPKKTGMKILGKKRYPVAWFASNCNTNGKREIFVQELSDYLKRFGIDIHIVGTCGNRKCPTKKGKDCLKILQRYYFYLAFENSLSEDYVSGEVLKGLQHYSVPVVLGGAKYSRFLPPHSYINTKTLGPKRTATKIARLILNTTEYLEYFNWHNHYTIRETSNSVCELCEKLNIGFRNVQTNFRNWWNPYFELHCKMRNKRSTIRSKILNMVLSSTCSLEETPYLVGAFRSSNIYRINE